MTTKTDFHSIMELREKYSPKTRGIVSGEEVAVIRAALEIDARNDIELQNIRDMVVMLYGQWSGTLRERYEASKDEETFDKSMEYMDAMSAIACVIDNEKMKRGLEV